MPWHTELVQTAQPTLGDFIKARRGQVSPDEAGIRSIGPRRVPGLRREELALLAGVSSDYLVRLEQGRDTHPSDQVLDALARALELNEAEHDYLQRLARTSTARRRHRRMEPEVVAPAVARLMDAWEHTPAFVLGRRLDVLTANAMAMALHSEVPGFAEGRANMVRHVFLDASARESYPDWEAVAADTVANLRGLAGADPDDPGLVELVGEVSVKSEHFATLWARQRVRLKAAGHKRIHHPSIGELHLEFESLEVTSAPGQILVAYTAQAGSESENGLRLLASLAATSSIDAASPDGPPRLVERRD